MHIYTGRLWWWMGHGIKYYATKKLEFLVERLVSFGVVRQLQKCQNQLVTLQVKEIQAVTERQWSLWPHFTTNV